ncbi:WD40 repeat domain-containing protein [Croceivirga radicis]|uniref:hypothetical protein n=1 Tax=Croceivirga radicis TaxID=1929488 RepID=UPI000255B6D6|nr:hypothetical protein [Croceivirga radicis]
MIKADTIKRLSNEVVSKELLEMFETVGFKYLKSKRHFKKSKGNFDHIISFGTPHSPLEFDDQKDELLLKFHFNVSIESPKFDKWVEKTLKTRSYFRHSLETINCIEVLDLNQLTKTDFFTPTESQKFKNYVTSSLVGPDTTKRIDISELKKQIPKIVNSLETKSSAINLFEKRTQAFRDYYRLLVFENELELAKEQYLKTIDEVKSSINEKLETTPKEAKKSIQGLEGFINETQTLLGIEISNPFSRELKKSNLKDQRIRLSPKLGYKEYLRFDSSMIDIKSYDINDKGETLLLTSDNELIKIEESGQFKTIAQLTFDNCFTNDSSSFKIYWLEIPRLFVCNNYLIEENDKIIELKLDFNSSQHKESSLDPTIKELLYDQSTNQFHILFTPYVPFSGNFKETYHFIYSRSGKLKSTKRIERNCIKLNLNRQEIIATSEGNSYDTIDFDGNTKSNFKFGNGNDRVSISPDGNLMALYFYSTKSQLYNLETEKKKTLWAHPTYLKGYKENFYNDINHNFGMTLCVFTPDGKHLIGGADHGKYVLWDTSKFERKELIPSESSFEIFNWFTTTYKDGKSTNNYFKPFSITLENQKIFINRGYDLSSVSFINQGEYIITQVSDCLLIWDSEFNNVGHVYGIGKVVFSSNNYLAFITNNEFVVFKRDLNFNDSFESSVFKERKGEDSSITNHVVDELIDEQEQIKERIDKFEKNIPEKRKGFFAKIFKRKST